jgi:hypothetical protein
MHYYKHDIKYFCITDNISRFKTLLLAITLLYVLHYLSKIQSNNYNVYLNARVYINNINRNMENHINITYTNASLCDNCTLVCWLCFLFIRNRSEPDKTMTILFY